MIPDHASVEPIAARDKRVRLAVLGRKAHTL
jgi:hypothetical protein